MVVLVMVPVHLLSASAAEIGFTWDPVALAWVRPGLPLLSNLAGPVQHSKSALLDAWRNKVAADLCGRKGFRCGPLLDIYGSLQLLNSSHFRERDKALLRNVMVGGVWNGLLLGRVRGRDVPCRFCGAPDNDGHLFWDCPLPPLVEIRENPEFHDLMRLDLVNWPCCLLWHGWLPMLSGVNGASPWAVDASESAAYFAEVALGRNSSGLIAEWSPSDEFDRGIAVSSLLDHLMSGQMAALFLIGILVFPLQVLVFLLTSLSISGGVVGGVTLRMFVLVLMFRLVGGVVLFLGLFNLFRGLKCRGCFSLANLSCCSPWC